jgi:NADPH-dependent 2,4-dienoyl-CoA reductase/sulfur reductase-like enzyme
LGEQEVEYHPNTRVTALDVEAHRLAIEGQPDLHYDRLLLASGGRLHAPVAGADMPGVYNFKSLKAAEALVARVRSGEARRAIVVGAGFIGMEIALLLRELGVEVIQLEMLEQVMAGMLDADTAAIVLQQMQKRGVDVRLKTRVAAFTGNGQASGVLLDSGETLQAELLIAATGIQPNLDYLAGSGVTHAWGVPVDEHMRTNLSDVYAAGDVAETHDLLTGERYVHAIFPNAVAQGRVAGFNLAGLDVTYPGAERFNSLKHLGISVVAAGLKQGDEVLQERRGANLRTLYLQEDRLVGFQLVGDTRAAGSLHALMVKGSSVKAIKGRLLEAGFGTGVLAWQAMEAMV